jgi:hypothetical protein
MDMKTRGFFEIMFIIMFIVALCFFASCDEDDVIRQSYRVNLPALPDVWLEILGEAAWHIEWVGEDGAMHSVEKLQGGIQPYVDLMQSWTTPVSAWPYWQGIKYGVMKPAGAIFPLDVSGSSIKLSWNGGVDAVFFWELATLDNEKRLPSNFNWKRFRELFSGAQLPEDVLSDPWLADWKDIAIKTAASGFDRRRIVSQKRSSLSLNIPANGPWIGASPFISGKGWQTGETVIVKLGSQVESYFCPTGILHCSSATWTWLKYNHNQ